MNNWKNRFIYVGLVLLIWVIQNAHLLTAFTKYNTDDSKFTSFVYKGSMGFAMDNSAYGTVLQHTKNNPSLFRTDNLIFENSDKQFADGQFVILIASSVFNFTNSLDITVLILSFLSIALSVLLLIKIMQLGMNQRSWLLAFIISTLILATGFDDYLGITKSVNNLLNNHNYISFKMHLGYANRFPYGQVSLPLFLFWVYALIKFLKKNHWQNGILLGISLVILQYSYFYYWSFGLFITGSFFLLKIRTYKSWLISILIYLTFTSIFWMNFFEFNQTEFASEYLNRVKGLEYYPSTMIHLIGIGISFYVFRDQKIIPSILSISSIIGMQFIIEFLQFTFQDYHWMYWTGRVVIICALIMNIIWIQQKAKIKALDALFILNYWGIFLFINLKFLLGFNVQPYHWVFATFHPILGISVGWILFQAIPLRKFLLTITCCVVILGVYNGICFGNTAGKYWKLTAEELEIIEYIEKENHPVLIGNNFPFLITIAAHTPCDLYMGTSNNKLSEYPESYYRFIDNFKSMGYSDQEIVKEYDKHFQCNAYEEKYKELNDSLNLVWPNNTLLAAEALHHYFLKPQDYFQDLVNAQADYDSAKFKFKKDVVIIYKPTFSGNYNAFNSAPVLDTKNFSIYPAN